MTKKKKAKAYKKNKVKEVVNVGVEPSVRGASQRYSDVSKFLEVMKKINEKTNESFVEVGLPENIKDIVIYKDKETNELVVNYNIEEDIGGREED